MLPTSNGSALMRCAYVAVVLAIALMPLSCGETADPVEPVSTAALAAADGAGAYALNAPGRGPAGFFPLSEGDEWNYSGDIAIESDGISTHNPYTERQVIDGTEELFGREYVIQRHEQHVGGCVDPDLSWVRYRQDKAGLFEADVSITDPPGDGPDLSESAGRRAGAAGRWDIVWKELSAGLSDREMEALAGARADLARKVQAVDRALGRVSGGAGPAGGPPGGVLSGEITRLAYPLHPGQEWVIRDAPLFTSRVIRLEAVETPAGRFNAWRVRIYPPVTDPDDEVVLWFAREGLIALRIHLVGYDWDTGRTMVSEEVMHLDDYDLGRSSGRGGGSGHEADI